VRISKGESMFCYPEHITDQMRRLFGDLADQNYLRDIEPPPFAHGVAHFLTQLNAIHPFREGNGRTQNLFLGMIADRAGHPLDHDRIEPPKLLDAMIRSFFGDEELLSQVIFDALRG
jgi:cell filamentation protein